MNPESLFFDNVKENRGWYFVEYSPPIPNYPFATVQIVALNQPSIADVVRAMEDELDVWLRKYPIPIMVSAFDCTGSVYDLSSDKPCNHLMGFEDSSGEVKRFWRLPKAHEMPTIALDPGRLKKIYAAIPHRTSAQLRAAALQKAREIRIGSRIAWTLVFMWVVVIPITIAVLGFTSIIVGVATTVYSIMHGVFKALKLTGVIKPSARQREKDREEALMRHHHYHCQRNPQGFQRLKLENLEQEERERIQREGHSLKRKEILKRPEPTG